MSGASAVSQTPARRAQPTLVFRQIVAPVQPGHALGAALVEGRGKCLFAGLVTTALTGKDRDPGDRARKKFRAVPEFWAITKSQRIRERAVIISSTIPSTKYSYSGSPLKLENGSTAIEGLSGSESAALDGAPLEALLVAGRRTR